MMLLSRNPLLPFTVPFVIGIFLYYGVGQMGWLLLLPVAISTMLYLMRRRLVALMIAGCIVGYLTASFRAPSQLPDGITGRNCLYSGVVTGETESGSMRVMVVRVDSCNGRVSARFLLKCILPTLGICIEECDRVTFVADVRPLSHITDLPDETDYNTSMSRQGVVGEAFIVPDSIMNVVAEQGFVNNIRRLRFDMASILAEGSLSPEASDFLIATLAGEREILTPYHRALFSSSGLAHLLAISGLHVSILAGVLSVFLFPLTLFGCRKAAGVMTIVLLWCFSIMTGMTPSVTRSVLMCTVFLVATMSQREWMPVNSLCAAAVAILFVSPWAVFSIGFQLSFMAVMSIFLFAEKLNPFSTRRSDARRWMMLITVPVAAMLGTGIVSIFHFHSFPVLFLISNVFASLVLPLLLGGGVIKVVLGIAGFSPRWLDVVIDRLYDILHGVADVVTSCPGALVSGLYLRPLEVVAYFVTLGLFALWLYYRRSACLAAMSIMLVFTVSLPYIYKEHHAEAELYVTRSHSETTAVVKDGEQLLSYTTARNVAARAVMERDSARYAGYMLRRGLLAITPLHDGYTSNVLNREGDMITFRDRRLVFINSDSLPPMRKRPHYAIVCRGFRGDIRDIISRLGPDSVILSSDIVLRRHDRYARELSEMGAHFRSLRDAPLVLR